MKFSIPISSTMLSSCRRKPGPGEVGDQAPLDLENAELLADGDRIDGARHAVVVRHELQLDIDIGVLRLELLDQLVDLRDRLRRVLRRQERDGLLVLRRRGPGDQGERHGQRQRGGARLRCLNTNTCFISASSTLFSAALTSCPATGGASQPFKAPAPQPATRWRCMNPDRMISGPVTASAPAMSQPQL